MAQPTIEERLAEIERKLDLLLELHEAKSFGAIPAAPRKPAKRKPRLVGTPGHSEEGIKAAAIWGLVPVGKKR